MTSLRILIRNYSDFEHAMEEEVRGFEMRLISRALELTGGNQARAARMLGLGTTTLNYKIKSYEML